MNLEILWGSVLGKLKLNCSTGTIIPCGHVGPWIPRDPKKGLMGSLGILSDPKKWNDRENRAPYRFLPERQGQDREPRDSKKGRTGSLGIHQDSLGSPRASLRIP